MKLVFSMFNVVVLCLISFTSTGQVNALTKCDSANEIEQVRIYNEKLNRMIHGSLNDDYLVRYVAKPSFDPEYAFQISELDNSTYELIALTFSQNLWYAKDVDSLFIKRRNIDSRLVSSVANLFKLLTDSITPQHTIGDLDGTDYIFMYNSNGTIRCGQTWSPGEKNILGEVVQICDDLMLFAKGKEIELLDLEEKINFANKQFHSRLDQDTSDVCMITFMEVAPVFKGDLIEFIQGELDYPASAKNDNLEGTVFIAFTIDTAGCTDDHKVAKGIREDLDNEALRVAKLIKFETPAMQRDKPIKVKFVVPVKFNIKSYNKLHKSKELKIRK